MIVGIDLLLSHVSGYLKAHVRNIRTRRLEAFEVGTGQSCQRKSSRMRKESEVGVITRREINMYGRSVTSSFRIWKRDLCSAARRESYRGRISVEYDENKDGGARSIG